MEKKYLNKSYIENQKKIVLNYKLNYMRYNVDKLKFPKITSLLPETAVKLTDQIGEEHPRWHIKKILNLLEKNLQENKLFS